MDAKAAMVTQGIRRALSIWKSAAKPRDRRKFYGDFIAIVNFVGRNVWPFFA